jgi:hypothetical protein
MTTEERFEKIEAGIRDLIVVGRTSLNAIEQLGGTVGQLGGTVGQLGGTVGQLSGTVERLSGVMRESIEELWEAQKHTDERFDALLQAQTETEQKLARLTEIVDKLVRSRGPNGPSAT